MESYQNGVELDDIQRIWGFFYQGLRQKAISQKMGLPVLLERAVLHGHYSFKGSKAVVDITTMPIREGQDLN